MEGWRERSLRATVVLLVTSVVLIGPALAGIGGSPVLALALGLVTAVLVLGRDRLDTLSTVLGHDLGLYGRDLWIGPLLATAAVAVFPDATPAELQTLGGIAGFVGMVNYFLRPAYLFVYRLFVRLGGALSQ